MFDMRTIRMLVLDVDGVLTDGSICLDEHGTEIKRFHVRDGLGISLARRSGMKVAVLTGRSSRAVTLRLQELSVDLVFQGREDKGAGFERLCQQAGVAAEQTAYMGDDLLDLPALARCGYPMAVADAAAEVRSGAKFVTSLPGGHGAVREAVEHMLKAQGLWQSMVDALATGAGAAGARQ